MDPPVPQTEVATPDSGEMARVAKLRAHRRVLEARLAAESVSPGSDDLVSPELNQEAPREEATDEAAELEERLKAFGSLRVGPSGMVVSPRAGKGKKAARRRIQEQLDARVPRRQGQEGGAVPTL